jgi:hypothetical protein
MCVDCRSPDMRRWTRYLPTLVVVYLGAAFWHAEHVPDLPFSEAGGLISRAPEFNRYARLAEVKGIQHMKDSMDRTSYGSFTFQHLNAPADVAQIRAEADFGYWRGAWHLNNFTYGCPSDCHTVDVYKEPVDDSHPLRDLLLFRF